MMMSGLACLATGLVPATWPTYATTATFLIGKFGVSCGFGTIYLYTSELFPTTLRNLGVGMSSMIGRQVFN